MPVVLHLAFSFLLLLLPFPGFASEGFWGATGRLERADGQGVCSATLVAPDLIVTAAHCAPMDKINDTNAPKLFFRPNSPKRASHLAAVRAVHHPLHAPDREGRSWRFGFDLALLRLARPLPVKFHMPLPIGAPPAGDEPLLLVSWRKGWTGPRSRTCAYLQSPLNVLHVDCPVRSGESGGAILRPVADGFELVGVMTSQLREGESDIGQASHLQGRLAPMLRTLERLEEGG